MHLNNAQLPWWSLPFRNGNDVVQSSTFDMLFHFDNVNGSRRSFLSRPAAALKLHFRTALPLPPSLQSRQYPLHFTTRSILAPTAFHTVSPTNLLTKELQPIFVTEIPFERSRVFSEVFLLSNTPFVTVQKVFRWKDWFVMTNGIFQMGCMGRSSWRRSIDLP